MNRVFFDELDYTVSLNLAMSFRMIIPSSQYLIPRFKSETQVKLNMSRLVKTRENPKNRGLFRKGKLLVGPADSRISFFCKTSSRKSVFFTRKFASSQSKNVNKQFHELLIFQTTIHQNQHHVF